LTFLNDHSECSHEWILGRQGGFGRREKKAKWEKSRKNANMYVGEEKERSKFSRIPALGTE